jgi:hypothetical protein
MNSIMNLFARASSNLRLWGFHLSRSLSAASRIALMRPIAMPTPAVTHADNGNGTLTDRITPLPRCAAFDCGRIAANKIERS